MTRAFERSCSAGVRLHVDVLDDAVVRFHYIRGDAPQAERGWFADFGAFAGPTALAVHEQGPALRLETAALVVVVDAQCEVRIEDHADHLLWQDLPGGGFRAGADGSVELARKLAPGERVYGLGEKTGAGDRRGRRLVEWNSDPVWTDAEHQYRTVTDPLYQSHPFLIAVAEGRASASFLANSRRSWFDVGASDPDVLRFGAQGGDLDHVFVYGPAPADVLERFTRLTGRASMPPVWALGYHQSRWSYAPAARVNAIADGFRARLLPCDGLWLDIDYMRDHRSFTWDPVGFPMPESLIAGWGDKGFKLTAILDPGIKRDPDAGYDVYDEGVAGGHFLMTMAGEPFVGKVWPGDAVFPDFSRAQTRGFWGVHVAAMARTGLRGFWIDMNEPTSWTDEGVPSTLPADGDGVPTTMAELHNVYALLMARATFEGALLAHPDTRPFVLTRAGFTGVQRYAAVWTGDVQSTWEHLSMVPAMLAGLGVSGVPFVGSDVGGFSGGPTAELYGRWFEMGTVSPFFRSHVQTGAPDQEPWAFGAEIEARAHELLGLRYRLMPYLYAAFDRAHRQGTPILRPIWFELPDESGHDDELFLGDSLLVAPVLTEGATTRDVYLPAGTYYDFWSGAAYAGPAHVTVSSPLGRIPLFVRAGAVLPTSESVQYVGAGGVAVSALEVYPGPAGTRARSIVYQDDGDSLGYTRGEFARTAIDVAVTPAGMTLDVAPQEGDFAAPEHAALLRVHLGTTPSAVLDGDAPADWRWDADTRTAVVRLRAGLTPRRLTLDFDATQLPAPREVAVRFEVVVPGSTPGPVYLATSLLGWRPDGLPLHPSADGTHWTGTVRAPEGALLLYKYTRGSWGLVESDPSCVDRPNRARVAAAGGGPQDGAVDQVDAWLDRCGVARAGTL
jgi:alpha-glucosidase